MSLRSVTEELLIHKELGSVKLDFDGKRERKTSQVFLELCLYSSILW